MAMATDRAGNTTTRRTGELEEPAARFLSATEEAAEAIRRLAAEDVTALPLLDRAACRHLVLAAEKLTFRRASPIVGSPGRLVRQDFDLTVDFPPESPFRRLARALDALLAEACAGLDPPAVDPAIGFRLNDLILQRYAAGSEGITPHRDHVNYKGLVAVVPLSGSGAFYVCADREGNGRREVPAPVGNLVLMRAPGYRCDRPRPFHGVSDIGAERYSFGLRYDVTRDMDENSAV